MFKRATSLSLLMAAAFFVPMDRAMAANEPAGTAPSELVQTNLPPAPESGLVSLDFQDADIKNGC